jgi:hypothetical protein
MKSHFGDEYPDAIILHGTRMRLISERRWVRSYASKDRKTGCDISRFMDGSAAITFPEFAREWPTWTEQDRLEFCGSCTWIHQQADFPDMLRYMMGHAGTTDWSAIANSVAECLPRDEAFDFLTRALRASDPGNSSNFSQGISLTRHRGAEGVLRAHLPDLWSHPSLWKDDEFTNYIAFDATTCIVHLIELGASPVDFEEQVRELSMHRCSGNRESCRNYLQKHYS